MLFKRLLSSLFVFVIVSQTACAESDGPMHLPLDPTPISVTTKNGTTKIKVEIAKISSERARGLMFREKLPQGQGMLFVFEEPDFRNFWMKNTPEPLDIVYIAQDGSIVSIQHGEPLSREPIPSGGPAQFVLELARGEAVRIGLMPGDWLSHPSFNPASK
jgi:uncharacterized protein